MTSSRLAAGLLALAAIALPLNAAAPPRKPARPASKNLPRTGLAPAKLVPDICLLRYPISTSSQACQDYFNQALGYYYSYVWLEASRSFDTAIQHDPNCPMAWWGLARAAEQSHKGDINKALRQAWDLRGNASDREMRLIKASMEEKGLLPGSGTGEQRTRKAIATIDEMLSLYDDDEEAWFFRARLAGGWKFFGREPAAVPFYKAMLRINPLHPGANHELLHHAENIQRPALGWVNAENYIKSSPGIPHPFHMQAHLATRLGRWDKTSDRSARAIELERGYHRYQNVTPREDAQYGHHLQVLLLSLIHDGRFAEGREIEKECRAIDHRFNDVFFRLHLAERDFAGALKIADAVRAGEGKRLFRRGGDKVLASYMSALVYLKQGNATRALPEIEVIQTAQRGRKNDRGLELQLWEIQGLYLCRTGEAATGLKLLAKTVEQTKNDFYHHAWGNGSYYMEAWGSAALACGKLDMAEEAFNEALAHDPGSVRAALGMEVLCERTGRLEEAERSAALARRCWGRADPGRLQTELSALRGERGTPSDPTLGGKNRQEQNRARKKSQ
jgi:tetratricopeptide (TPR) repeat protein